MSKRILNLGAGNETYGTDFLDIYPSSKKVRKWSAHDRIPFENNTFDEVYTKNFFEHLTNPNKVLTEIWRVLKPEGRLILITDNASFFGWHLGKTHYGGYEKVHDPDDRHYALYTSWHLKNHLENVGFKIISSRYILGNIRNKVHYMSFKTVGIVSKRIGYNLIKIIAIKPNKKK